MRRGVLFVVLAGLLSFTVCCHARTEQDKIKEVVTSVQKAAQDKDIRTIIGCLSKSYRDPQGNDYDSIKGILLGYFFRHPKIHVYIPGIDVILQDSGARAVFQAVLSGGNMSGLVPEALGMYSFEVSLAKESGEWKVTSAKWERAGSQEGEKTGSP